ncbi:hypothetical protein SprV_0200834600 [Sparganum proliferum]
MRLRPQIRWRSQGKRSPGRLDTVLLDLPAHRLDLRNQLTQLLDGLQAPDDNATVGKRWCHLRNVIQSTVLDVRGRARRRHQDWFDDPQPRVYQYLTRRREQTTQSQHRPPDRRQQSDLLQRLPSRAAASAGDAGHLVESNDRGNSKAFSAADLRKVDVPYTIRDADFLITLDLLVDDRQPTFMIGPPPSP